MLIFALLLGLTSLCVGAAFSGSETAFYRVSKLKLKLEALEGDRTAKHLIWFVNNSGMFITTILVGNNVANYFISMATVLLVGAIFADSHSVILDIASTMILAPFLFVYGEAFPKNLCLQAPTQLLRIFVPVLNFIFWLFLPITMFLWLFSKLIALFFGNADNLVSLSLGRKELSGILDEGTKNGILFDTQRQLANGIFQCSGQTIRSIVIPPDSFPRITTEMKPEFALEIARQQNLIEMPVYETDVERETNPVPVGFVRTIDLEIAVRHKLDEQARQLQQLLRTKLPLRSTVEIADRHTLLTGLIILLTMHGTFGCVLDEKRRCVGFTTADQIRSVLQTSGQNVESLPE
ncbi:hypothetical protein FACS189454_03070 [Planctomycetales bacterium]|nr:hypothetical protein FACS189454_03070 [Planctomycetales bacterium]